MTSVVLYIHLYPLETVNSKFDTIYAFSHFSCTRSDELTLSQRWFKVIPLNQRWFNVGSTLRINNISYAGNIRSIIYPFISFVNTEFKVWYNICIFFSLQLDAQRWTDTESTPIQGDDVESALIQCWFDVAWRLGSYISVYNPTNLNRICNV